MHNLGEKSELKITKGEEDVLDLLDGVHIRSITSYRSNPTSITTTDDCIQVIINTKKTSRFASAIKKKYASYVEETRKEFE